MIHLFMDTFLKKIIVLCSVTIALTAIAQGQQPSELIQIAAQVKEFYFVRHGTTDYNAGIVTTCLDLSLNEHGQQQAVAIKPIIASLPVKTVCFSPLLRARKTKNIITAPLEVTEHEITDLAECTVQEWMELSSLSKDLRKASTSLQRFVQQVSSGIGQSLQKADRPVLIVAHGGVYYALCYLLNAAVDDWTIDHCVPVRFYLDDDNHWKVKKLGCVNQILPDPYQAPCKI